jgi:DNA-binding transcriptional ArsR family regulator
MNCGEDREHQNIKALSVEERKAMLAKLSKGLAHPARIEIITILTNQPSKAKCICGDIVNALPLAQSSVSQHLKILKETGWIEGIIDGPRVCYCLIGGIMEFYETLIRGALKDEVTIVEMKGKTEEERLNV